MAIESPQFSSTEKQHEDEVREKLSHQKGILYEEETDTETGEKRAYVNILGTRLETEATREEVEEIKENLVMSDLSQKLFHQAAVSYSLNQPVLFEGDPGAGKTYSLEILNQLLHGKHEPKLELAGTPRTSELEILGHWAPKGAKEEDTKKLIERVKERDDHAAIGSEIESEITALAQGLENGEITEEDFGQKFSNIVERNYGERVRALMRQVAEEEGISSEDSEWEFKKGALLEAYTGNNGKGRMLIVDEFNAIPSNYQQIFLQIGGVRGRISDQIAFFGNSGQTNYHKGEHTWIAFTSNYPEKTSGRSEVAAPMTDRVNWVTISEQEASDNKGRFIETDGGLLTVSEQDAGILSDAMGLDVVPGSNIQKDSIRIPSAEQVDFKNDQYVHQLIASTVKQLDKAFEKMYIAGGDTVSVHGEERTREQKLELSARSSFRMYAYLRNFQISDDQGNVDIGETIKRAFDFYYLNRIASEEKRDYLQGVLNQIIDGETGQVNLDVMKNNGITQSGGTVTRREAINTLLKERVMTPRNKDDAHEEGNEKRIEKITHEIASLQQQSRELSDQKGVLD